MGIVVGTVYSPLGILVAPVWATDGVGELRDFLARYGMGHIKIWKPPYVRFIHAEISKDWYSWMKRQRWEAGEVIFGDDFAMLEWIATLEGDDLWLEFLARERRGKNGGRRSSPAQLTMEF